MGKLTHGRPGACHAADGTPIYFETHGDPQNLALFLGPHFYATRSEKDECESAPWIDMLQQDFFLILADYPRGMGRTTAPQGLAFNPDVATEEYLRIAHAAKVHRFGWLGYSFGGAMGLQVACRTDRVTALAMGGFPPLNAPIERLVEIHRNMAEHGTSTPHVEPGVILSAIGFYHALLTWPDRAEIAKLRMPRMVFMGDHDGTADADALPLAALLRDSEGDLVKLGWQVVWLLGEDHLSTLNAPAARTAVHRFFHQALRHHRETRYL